MKYFFIKLIAISIIVCTTQYGYYFFLSQYFPSIKKTNITFQRLQESLKQKPDIVFCGSSTNFSGDKKDKDIRKISEFLAEELPACKIVSVSWIAYTIEIFNKIVKYTNKHNKKPTQFIIELSLPTFSKSALEPSNTTYLKENEIIFSDDVHSAFFIRYLFLNISSIV